MIPGLDTSHNTYYNIRTFYRTALGKIPIGLYFLNMEEKFHTAMIFTNKSRTEMEQYRKTSRK